MPKFPLHYRPRPYQEDLHSMWRSKRVGVAIMHRQSGKDVAMSAEAVERRLRMPKTTAVYVSLNKPMIRDILWQKTYYCPDCGEFIRSLQDNTPRELCTWKDTVMEGVFTNGSRLKLDGYFQAGQDKNGVGTSFQDYFFTELALFMREDPLPRLMPIIQNEHEPKRLGVASTPRGKRKNPLWQLMKAFEGNPEYGQIVRTIEDTNAMMVARGLPPVISQARLEEIEDTYLRRYGNNRMFMQEYYCDFEEMDAAAVYGEAYMKMLKEGRIARFNLNPAHPVYVMFDIGSAGIHSDATSWIAFQWYNNQHFLYDCGEDHGKALPEYIDVLRTKHYYNQIAALILPWDAEHHEVQVTTTPADMMRQKFERRVAVLAKSRQVYKLPNGRQGDFDEITDIQATRMAMYNMHVNAEPEVEVLLDSEGMPIPRPRSADAWCERVTECFENYKYEFDTRLQEWTQKPVHDQYSHMMDTVRYLVQSTKELEFFGGQWFDEQTAAVGANHGTSYEDDWSGVWRR